MFKLFRFKSIKARLLVPLAISMIVLFVILGVLLFFQFQNIILPRNVMYNREIVSARADQLSVYLESKENEIKGLSERKGVKNMEWERVKSQLIEFYDSNTIAYEKIVLVKRDGEGNDTLGDFNDYSDTPFYEAIINEGQERYIGNPKESESTENVVVNIAHSVVNDSGKVVGIVVGALKLDRLDKIADQIKVGDTGYAAVVDGTGLTITHPDESLVMTFNMLEADQNGFEGLAELGAEMVDGKTDHGRFDDPNGNEKMVYFQKIPGTPNWSFSVIMNYEEVREQNVKLLLFTMIMLIIILGISLVVIYMISRSISKPIKLMADKIKAVGDGDLTVEFMVKTEDEIGQIFSSLIEMVSNFREAITSIDNSTDSVEASAGELSTMAEQDSANAEELLSQSEEVDSNVQNTSASIEEVSSGIQEVAASAQDVSKNSQELSNQVSETQNAVENGQKELKDQAKKMEAVGRQNQEATDIVKEVAEKSNNVQEIVNTISSIAEQTNLLALNAAIEAARAGEAGKGFAVVADEIRKLAEESQESSANIARILNEIDEKANSANTAVEKSTSLYKEVVQGRENIATQFNTIMETVEAITERVESLTGSAEEQSASADEMASAMDSSAKSMTNVTEQMTDITDGIKRTAESAQKINATAEELNGLSNELNQLVKKFKIR